MTETNCDLLVDMGAVGYWNSKYPFKVRLTSKLTTWSLAPERMTGILPRYCGKNRRRYT